MTMSYPDLTETVRVFMAQEVEHDGDDLYAGKFFNDAGVAAWKTLLLEACVSGTDASLAAAIRSKPYLRAQYERRTKNGISMVKVPYNAHETIADNNFSRFYLRGLCRHAIEIGVPHLVGYRAKRVDNPRPGSNEKIGAIFPVTDMLADLRATMSTSPALGMPPGVGSGILARLP